MSLGVELICRQWLHFSLEILSIKDGSEKVILFWALILEWSELFISCTGLEVSGNDILSPSNDGPLQAWTLLSPQITQLQASDSWLGRGYALVGYGRKVQKTELWPTVILKIKKIPSSESLIGEKLRHNGKTGELMGIWEEKGNTYLGMWLKPLTVREAHVPTGLAAFAVKAFPHRALLPHMGCFSFFFFFVIFF